MCVVDPGAYGALAEGGRQRESRHRPQSACIECGAREFDTVRVCVCVGGWGCVGVGVGWVMRCLCAAAGSEEERPKRFVQCGNDLLSQKVSVSVLLSVCACVCVCVCVCVSVWGVRMHTL